MHPSAPKRSSERRTRLSHSTIELDCHTRLSRGACAEARGRTGTPVKAADFESAASAYSATSAMKRGRSILRKFTLSRETLAKNGGRPVGVRLTTPSPLGFTGGDRPKLPYREPSARDAATPQHTRPKRRVFAPSHPT